MESQLNLASVTTLRLGGRAKAWCQLTNLQSIHKALSESKRLNWPLFVLGEGSNTIFDDKEHNLLIGLMQIKGIEIKDKGKDILIKAGAGENWDQLVDLTVKNNLIGLEALSAIPGTVGAAPVQNIGAYGAEIANSLLEVEAIDTKTGEIVKITNDNCGFSYRDSIFKRQPGRFIITHITLKLSKLNGLPPIPDYKGVKEYLANNKILSPTLSDIREAITNIRWSKLPPPTKLSNNGSFFKNPIVSDKQANKLLTQYPDMPHFPNNGSVKIPAGWLIEQVGLKGSHEGPIGTYDKNALVIVNYGGATYDDLDNFIRKITTTVKNKFDIELEPEVNIIT